MCSGGAARVPPCLKRAPVEGPRISGGESGVLAGRCPGEEGQELVVTSTFSLLPCPAPQFSEPSLAY